MQVPVIITNIKVPIEWAIVIPITCFDNAFLNAVKGYELKHTVFVIDLHCTFSGYARMEQCGGVEIYKYLKKVFSEKIQVGFFSPVCEKDLKRLKPAICYILKDLPFIECTYEKGKFERDLKKLISKNYP